MLALARATWRQSNALNRNPTGILRNAERLAAVASAAIILAAAAMPNDEDQSAPAAAAAAATPRVSTALAPDRETNFGAYLGAPYHHPSDFWLKKAGQTDLTIKDVEWFTKPFENPLYYGVRLQRWFTGGRFGTMIDFVHSKAYAPFDQPRPMTGTLNGKPVPSEGKPGDYFNKLEWSHGHNMLTLNGLVRIFQIGRFAPYGGIGAGISLPHSEIHLNTDPTRTYEYQYTGVTVQSLIGLEIRLRTGSIFVEYKFTNADYSGPLSGRDGSWLPLDMYHQFSRWWSGEEPRDGWAGARLTSHQLVGGFLVRFVPKPAIATP